MHDRSVRDRGICSSLNAELRVVVHDVLEEHRRQAADALDVFARLAVSEFDDRRQGIDERAVCLLNLLRLRLQLAGLPVQRNLLLVHDGA